MHVKLMKTKQNKDFFSIFTVVSFFFLNHFHFYFILLTKMFRQFQLFCYLLLNVIIISHHAGFSLVEFSIQTS